jgi:hypothetical protein
VEVRREFIPLVALAAALVAATCGGSSSTTPSVKTIVLSGTVQDAATSAPISGGRVDITTGPNAGKTTTTDAAGKYQLTEVTAASLTLRASGGNYIPQSASLSPTADQTHVFALALANFSTAATADDVLTQAPIAGVTVSGADVLSGVSGANGAFSILSSTSGLRPVSISSPSTVTRQSNLRVPGDGVVLDLIPNTFDTTALDQLVRTNSQSPLRRWTSAPGLILETRTLKFDTATQLVDAVALDDQMSDDDAQAMVADLTFALPLLTGGTFPAFSSVTIQTSDVGQVVHQHNTGFITVSRQSGLLTGSGVDAVGLGVWQTDLSSAVIGGAVGIDRNSDTPQLRPVRYHELGHALGYSHVATRTSIMNPSCCGVVQPNLFDQQATMIAFRRQPGSLSPDKDPGVSLNAVASAAAGWSSPIR